MLCPGLSAPFLNPSQPLPISHGLPLLWVPDRHQFLMTAFLLVRPCASKTLLQCQFFQEAFFCHIGKWCLSPTTLDPSQAQSAMSSTWSSPAMARYTPYLPTPTPFLAPSHPETLAELIWSHLSVKSAPGREEFKVCKGSS